MSSTSLHPSKLEEKTFSNLFASFVVRDMCRSILCLVLNDAFLSYIFPMISFHFICLKT